MHWVPYPEPNEASHTPLSLRPLQRRSPVMSPQTTTLILCFSFYQVSHVCYWVFTPLTLPLLSAAERTPSCCTSPRPPLTSPWGDAGANLAYSPSIYYFPVCRHADNSSILNLSWLMCIIITTKFIHIYIRLSWSISRNLRNQTGTLAPLSQKWTL